MLQLSLKKFHGHILIGILIAAAIVRLSYISYAGGSAIVKPDSQGYYVQEKFFGKHVLTNFFNPNRTPGYTMLTSLAMTATGHDYPPYASKAFFERTRIIIFTQMVISLLSLVVLYDTLLMLGISYTMSLAFTAITSINIYQFIWDRAILTESLYISLFIILMRFFVSLLKKPTRKMGVLFITLAVFEFLLRPAGLLVPYLLLPLVYLMHRTQKTLFLIMVLISVYTAIPVGMVAMNRYVYNFHGLSFNTDFAVFGRILLFDIPIDSAASVPNLYEKVNEYRARGGNVSIPWYFFVTYGNEVYGRLAELQEFNRLVIKGHLPEFAKSVVQDIPKAFFDTEVYGVLYRSPTPSITRSFFNVLDWTIRLIQKSTIIFLLLVIPTVWLFYKKRSRLHTFLLAIALLELYQLFSSLIFGGAWEFARHMITTQTYLFFFCFWWAFTALRYVVRVMGR